MLWQHEPLKTCRQQEKKTENKIIFLNVTVKFLLKSFFFSCSGEAMPIWLNIYKQIKSMGKAILGQIQGPSILIYSFTET